MPFRVRLIIGIMLAGLGAPAFFAQAAPYRALDLPSPSVYGDQPAPSESTRHEYVSQGQDYLRQYVRENLRRLVSETGILTMEATDMQTAATVNLATLAPATAALPWETKVRLWAAENLNDYLNCGRFIPLRMEMESNYKLTPGVDFSARVRAPFNNVLQVDLGSQMQWSSLVSSHWQYSLQNDAQVSGNFNVGLGMQWSEWQASLDFDLTPQRTQQQRFTVGKNF
ncbi:MAG: hypothetical protein HGA76_01120 [Candidatus Firestonebacteria bacterium]|nr:hypothetical protein [Candidatus Firestonebacteria bacterium]